jgi:mono/diheme cytochrome c family protein
MRHPARIAALVTICSSLLALSACGSEPVAVAKDSPYYAGAEIFAARCAGCHTLNVAGTQGSAIKASDKEITDGPNFNARGETESNIHYALRNGGFSGKIMPQNIVTGKDADEVAAFLAHYAGKDAPRAPAPSRDDDAGLTASDPTTPSAAAKIAESGTDASAPDPAATTTP